VPLGDLDRLERVALRIALDERAETEALEAEWREAEEIAAIMDGELTLVEGFQAFRERVLGEGRGGTPSPSGSSFKGCSDPCPNPSTDLPEKAMHSVLIANRGEIAVRIIRACRELGLRSVAVYSEADRGAPHVLLADEAYLLGPAPSAESYLRAWTGSWRWPAGPAPTPSTRATASWRSGPPLPGPSGRRGSSSWGRPPRPSTPWGTRPRPGAGWPRPGFPSSPGSRRPWPMPRRRRRWRRRWAIPVLLKASAGGGGKGMRVVEGPDGIRRAFEAASREAEAAFGDGAVYVEKYLERPRHIEIQLLGDRHGNVVHLGERECSIQRRHQKLVEEAPSPVLDAGPGRPWGRPRSGRPGPWTTRGPGRWSSSGRTGRSTSWR
jgi:hypothetical protein